MQERQQEAQSRSHATERQEAIRALGSTEQLFWLLDQNRPTHFALVAEVDRQFATEAWRDGLLALQQRHPLLSARIAANEQRCHGFYAAPGITIPLRVVETAHASWQAEVAAELATPFDPSTAPLVRATLLQGGEVSTLILVAHHAVADGMANSFLIGDLLRALSGERLAALELAQPLEVLLKDEVLAAPVSPPPQLAPKPQSFRPVESAVAHVEGIALSRELTTQLVAQARNEQTTLYGVIATAVHEAARRLSPEWCRHPVRTATPIDVRHFSGDIGTAAGVYITQTVTVDGHQRGAPFWEMARTIKRNVACAQTREATVTHLSDLQATMATRPSVEDAAGYLSAVLAFNLLLSNLGNDPIPSAYGRLKLNALWGPMVTSGFTDDQVVGVCTVDGVLRLTQTSHSAVTGLLEEVREVLEMAVRTNGGESQIINGMGTELV